MLAPFAVRIGWLLLAGLAAVSAALGADARSVAGAEKARVAVAEESVSVRDASRMLFLSPPYARGFNVDCFPYRALDEKAGFRGAPYVKQTLPVVTLENAYLRLAFLPSVGGRLWQAWCKPSRRPLFKSGQVLNQRELWKTGCGYMTATLGLRFDFPEWGHDPSAEQAWDYETGQEPGRAWVRLRYRERRTQLEISERITLRDDSAAIEIHTELGNPNPEPRPFKYWTIAYIPVGPDSEIVVPCDFIMYHAADQVWTWPVSGGADISRPARWAFDTSYFTAGLRHGFAAVLSPSARSGVARVFPLERAPGVKFYSEGSPDYVNFYGGLAETMEETLTLPAQGVYAWTERYYPLEGLAGLTLAGEAAAFHASLAGEGADRLTVRIMAADRLEGRLRVTGEGVADYETGLEAEPLDTREVAVPLTGANPDGALAITLERDGGGVLAWRGTRRELLPRAAEKIVAVEVGAEALVNGGFENYDDIQNRLPGWMARVWDGSGELEVVSGAAFTGDRALRLQRAEGNCKIGYSSDPVRVVPGEKYRLRFAYQAQGLKPGLMGQTAHAILTDASGWQVVRRIEAPEADTGWQVCEYAFAVPAGFDSLRVFLQLFGAGSVWFDDVSLLRLPDAAAVHDPAFTRAERAASAPAPTPRTGRAGLNGVKLAGRPRIFKLDRPSTLVQPFGLAIDARDNLFCFDGRFFNRHERRDEFRALKLSPRGRVELAFGAWGDEPGEWFHPGGFAVGPDGAIYVADAGHNRIGVFSAAGRFERSFGEAGAAPGRLDSPARLAFTADGELLVSEVGNARVAAYAPDGAFRRVVAGPDQLAAPFDVAVGADGRIFVADPGAHRVVILGADGSPRGTLGGYGLEPGRFVRPALLAPAPDGGLFVADTALARISQFDAGGTFRRVLGGGQGEFPRFRMISGLALNSRGELLVLDAAAPESLWVCDPVSGTVAPFAVSGREYERRPSAQLPAHRGVAIAPDGGLVFFMSNGYEQNLLRKCAPDGAVLWESGATGPAPGQWNRIGQVAFDAAGNLWVLDRGNARIQCLDPDGRLLKTIGRRGAGPGELSLPCDLAVGADGRLYVSDTGNRRVQVLEMDGRGVRSLSGGPGFFPGPLLVARSGDVWVRNMPDGSLWHFGADGRPRGRFEDLGVEPDWPHINPLAETPDGNILVADMVRKQWVCLSPAGERLPAPLPWPGNTAEVVRSVGGDFECKTIAFDGEGRLVAAGPCEWGNAFAVVRLEVP